MLRLPWCGSQRHLEVSQLQTWLMWVDPSSLPSLLGTQAGFSPTCSGQFMSQARVVGPTLPDPFHQHDSLFPHLLPLLDLTNEDMRNPDHQGPAPEDVCPVGLGLSQGQKVALSLPTLASSISQTRAGYSEKPELAFCSRGGAGGAAWQC